MVSSATDYAGEAGAEASSGGRALAAIWLERGLLGCLFLLAFSAPISIAGTQGAWLGGMLLWAARLFVKPRPALHRTPVDYALLGFFILTFVSTLFSYDPDVSIGKLRAASLFTIVYLVAENVASRRVLRALALVLLASCTISVLYTFAGRALGRGVKVEEMRWDSPLGQAGVGNGDTILALDGEAVGDLEQLEKALVGAAAEGRSARLRVYHFEQLLDLEVLGEQLLEGATPEARLGVGRWSPGRDERATGFYGQYQTYSEVLQLIGSLAVGMLVALGRKRSWWGALVAAIIAGISAALIMTVTRASWLGLLVSVIVIVLAGAASRRLILITACVAVPLVLAGLLVLQQKRRVGFLDSRDASTTWRLVVWREGLNVLVSRPRHLLVGVGMDSLKRRWREWQMFDRGRRPWGHLHSTPLQLAFERGVPTLLCWLALCALYARMLWRLARKSRVRDSVERGLVLGALGGLIGFLVSGLVHYNFGDSEVVMVFYLIMGLALAIERLAREGESKEATS
ncbi:MAG TPA: O-antigen ligase family protein [Pyrinomonadaceae bacterium]|jgi:hypothetical protein